MTSRTTISILVGFSAIVWALYRLTTGEFVDMTFFKPATLVIGLLSGIFIAFDKWIWRCGWVNHFLKRPVLSGTWSGSFRSSFEADEPGQLGAPTTAFLVIYQTFSEIHLRFLTDQSESTSVATSIRVLPDGRYQLAGLYRNEPGLAARQDSPIHYGGLILSLEGAGRDRLSGHYWTDRGTQGELVLSFVGRSEATDYLSAEAMPTPREPTV